MNTRLFAACTAVAAILAAPVFAQQTQPMRTAPTTQQATQNAGEQPSRHDQEFAKEAAIGGIAEVELGKLAQQKGQDPQVKQFGQRMVQDHTNANNQLKQIADSQNLQLPQQLDRKHQEVLDRLSRLDGNAFDRAYMSAMVKDHNEDVRAFRRESQSGRDPAIKQFAAQTLPVLEQHDKMAHDVDHSLTASGSSRAPH